MVKGGENIYVINFDRVDVHFVNYSQMWTTITSAGLEFLG